MAYIIENANIVSGDTIKESSLFVEEGKISTLKTAFPRYKHMRMNANSFLLTPIHVMYDSKFPNLGSHLNQKSYFTEEYILKGTTAVLTSVYVHFEKDLKTNIKRLKTNLLNSPIDYIIGVRIPLRLLTTSFLLKSKQERIPALFIEIDSVEELKNMPWGWIREAMFPYNSPLIPVIKYEQPSERTLALKTWKMIVKNEKIPALLGELPEKQNLSRSILAKIGIYPLKAAIQIGSELSYNLYLPGKEIIKIEELELNDYHKERLAVTVHKGTVIRAGDEVMYRPGAGEHVLIKTPSYFTFGD
ncbi:MAG: hypothetical protein AB2374_18515 [Cytobacillus gottheilii]|uniref:hypothetical protein n=1 Tax=Cytobacillus gottheilii TaxID=859144 RepID=UPI000835AB9D|nr:hypothetical protein [Cytobacillus gottheilii]